MMKDDFEENALFDRLIQDKKKLKCSGKCAFKIQRKNT